MQNVFKCWGLGPWGPVWHWQEPKGSLVTWGETNRDLGLELCRSMVSIVSMEGQHLGLLGLLLVVEKKR